jgi:hypothetical protein
MAYVETEGDGDMTDRELADLAGEALGMEAWLGDATWNPLESNDNAFLLAVRLGMTVTACHAFIGHPDEPELCKPIADVYVPAEDGDVMAATRRAIVMAAVEMRKGMA